MWRVVGLLWISLSIGAQVNVDFVAQVDLSQIGGGSALASGVWGFRIPDGREFAIICTDTTTAVYDLDDPASPVLVGSIAGSSAVTRDVQVYVFSNDPFQAHAYVSASSGGATNIDLQIIDLSNVPVSISEVSNNACPGFEVLSASRTHFGLKPSGFIGYVMGVDLMSGMNGVHVIDVSIPNQPCNKGTWVPPGSDLAQDMFLGTSWDDVRFDGSQIGIVFAGSTFHVVDFSEFYDLLNPTPMPADIYSYSSVSDDFLNCHSGWVDDSGRYLYALDSDDEFGPPAQNTRLKVYDLATLDDIQLVHTWTGPTQAVDHHALISGNYLYLANASEGLRLFSMTDPLDLNPFGHFDTFPANNGPGLDGAFEVFHYPFSGLVAMSDRAGGLFILDPLVPEDSCRDADLEGDGFDLDDFRQRSALWLNQEPSILALLVYTLCL